MKKQVVSRVLPHLWRGALLLVLLFALIQVMPIAFGQRSLGKMAAGVSQAPASTGAAGVVVAPSGQAVAKSRDNTLTSRSGVTTHPSGANAVGVPGLPNDSWAVRTPVPYNARGPFAVSDGTFVYVGGGYDGTSVHTDLLRYDPVANTFTTLAPSADAHFLSQAVILNNKIYNIAGFGLGLQTTTTRIYDIAGNTWTTGAPIPEALGLTDHATGLIGGKIYIAGGYNGTGAISTLRIYDIASDTWTTGASMPAALFLPGFGVINGKFYVASGNNGATEVNTLYIYDPVANTWTTGATVPTPVTGPGSAVANGKLYLFGGGAPFPTTITTTQIYDPVTNTWTTGANMNVNRLWFYGGTVGICSVVAPGGDTTPGLPINDNEQLTIMNCNLTVVSAVSRKTCGATNFDIALPLTCPSGVECRTGPYLVVASFSQAVSTSPTATIECATPPGATTGAVTVAGSDVMVVVNTTAGAEDIRIRIDGVNGSNGFEIPMGILIGDVNGNGSVNAADVAQDKACSGATLDQTNFRCDVNANCSLNAGDVALTKSKSGTAISRCCTP